MLDSETTELIADSHNTDPVIVEAIAGLTTAERGFEAIWQNPTNEEFASIVETATKNGAVNAAFLQWGDRMLADIISDPNA